MTLALASRRTALTPPWVRNALWRRARAVPSLDLRFADNKSLTDAVTGASLVTFTRASSGTYVDSAGVLQTAATNVPRFDHNPTTGESLGLLVEEQRSNLCLQSEDFSTTWSVAQLTVTANSIAAPNATTTADALFETTATSEHYTRQLFTGLTANTNYTVSVFAKDLGGRTLTFRVLDTDNVANGYLAMFSPSTGTVVTAATSVGSGVAASASVVPYANGWYRFILTGNAGATCTKYILDFFLTSGTNTNFAGDVTKGVYLWGADLQPGAFPTSYIPTTAAAATRNADVASITGSAFSGWYNAAEGTVYHQGRTTSAGSFFSIDDGTVNNRITSYMASATTPYFFVQTGGAVAANLTGSTITAGSTFAQANAYKAANFAMSTNGGTVATISSGTVPVVNKLVIGANIFNGAVICAPIRRLTYWPARLPNSTLQTLSQ